MVKKFSLYKMALKNFTGTNLNVKARTVRRQKKKAIKKRREGKRINKTSKELKNKGYTGKKLRKVYKKVYDSSREDKTRAAVAESIIKKRKR